MKYLKKYNESLSIEDNIKIAYDKYTSQGITDEDELRDLITEYIKKSNALGLALLIRGGMSDEFVKQNILYQINSFFKQLNKSKSKKK